MIRRLCGLWTAPTFLAAYVALIALLLFATPARAAPSFSVAGVSCPEGSPCAVTIRKSAKASSYSKVEVSTVDGTAKAGLDYAATDRILTISNSQLLTTVPVSIVARDGYQGDRGFTVHLKAVRNAVVAVADATVTITETSPAPTPVPAPSTGAYDASVGTGVTADGFALLPLRAGAHRYFVNSASGSDANGCSSDPAKPLKTIAAASNCITAGSGDQMLLAEGTRYAEPLPWLASRSGFSAQYPTVIQSYDPADPANESKYGRGDQRGARPVITMTADSNGNGTDYGFLAIRGLDFNPGNVPAVGVTFVGPVNYLLIENNLFRYAGLSIDRAGIASQAQHHVIRGNSFYGQWNTSGRAGGLYDAGVDFLTLEDNVFWHNGWKIGASRDDAPELGGATVFSHPFYLQTDTSSLVRRNLVADGSGDGANVRGDTLFTENVGMDNPICIGLGGGPQYNIDRPGGVKIEASYNACLGNDGVRSDHQIGWGITTANGLPGSRVHHNIIARSKNPAAPDTQGFSNYAAFNQPSYAQYDHNVMWLWVVPPNMTYYPGGGTYPAQAHTTYDSNVWDGPPEGTNVNIASWLAPKPYTQAQLIAELGFASKDAWKAWAAEHPEAHPSRRPLELLQAGYGIQRP